MKDYHHHCINHQRRLATQFPVNCLENPILEFQEAPLHTCQITPTNPIMITFLFKMAALVLTINKVHHIFHLTMETEIMATPHSSIPVDLALHQDQEWDLGLVLDLDLDRAQTWDGITTLTACHTT